MARNDNRLRIQSATRYLSDVRQFVERHALAAGFTEEVTEQFKLAVDEACTNVIKHAYKGNEGGRIDISVDVSPETFTVAIRDEGATFNPKKYRQPDIRQSIQQRRAGGYGIHLMRNIMDRVEFSTRGKINELQLIKYRNRENAVVAGKGE